MNPNGSPPIKRDGVWGTGGHRALPYGYVGPTEHSGPRASELGPSTQSAAIATDRDARAASPTATTWSTIRAGMSTPVVSIELRNSIV